MLGWVVVKGSMAMTLPPRGPRSIRVVPGTDPEPHPTPVPGSGAAFSGGASSSPRGP